MFYCNLEHTVKKAVKTRSGKIKNGATANNRFHYVTRTSHFKNYKESVSEQVEFVKSGNMPSFAEGKPADFWHAADVYERSNGRTCSSLVVALPKELSKAQRIELAEQFIAEFADRYRYPFTCAIHNHVGSIAGMEQPHLHFMYSERHVDGIERTPEQFFKRYNPKEPEKGGAQKLTADVLNMGKAQLQLYRQKTEELINASLAQHAPTKIVEIRGIPVEVPSLVSCLSHRDYNKKHGTKLKDVPMMNKEVRFARKNQPELLVKQQEMMAEINRIRAENNYELYQSYYQAELTHIQAAEKQKKAEREAEKKRQTEHEVQNLEQQKRDNEQLTRQKELQQRHVDPRQYSEAELKEMHQQLLEELKGKSHAWDVLERYENLDSTTRHLLNQDAFEPILDSLKISGLIKRFPLQYLDDGRKSFIQMDLNPADPAVWKMFDELCQDRECKRVLAYQIEQINDLVDALQRVDESRLRGFETQFSYQFDRFQRNELLTVFEATQSEMQELMKLYQNYAKPLAEKFFADDLSLQDQIGAAEERKQLIIAALKADLEPVIEMPKSQTAPKQETVWNRSNNYDGPSL